MTRPPPDDWPREGLPLSLDPAAASGDASLPAFLARPAYARVYHGFQILAGVERDGFRLGTISALGPADHGDAFVIAPDGSRAGLVWQLGDRRQLHELIGFEPGRWGVWGAWFARPMRPAEDARRNLEDVLRQLRAKWQDWKAATRGRQR